MNTLHSLVVRSGQHELRAVSHRLWVSRKRRRTEWACWECCGLSRRGFSDRGPGGPGIGNFRWQTPREVPDERSPRDVERREEGEKSKVDEAEREARRRNTMVHYLPQSGEYPGLRRYADPALDDSSVFEDVTSLGRRRESPAFADVATFGLRSVDIQRGDDAGDDAFLRLLEDLPDPHAPPEHSHLRKEMPFPGHGNNQPEPWERFEDRPFIRVWDREAAETFAPGGRTVLETSDPAIQPPNDYRADRPQNKKSPITAPLVRERPREDTLDYSLLEIDYRTILPQAISRGEADMIVRCLFAASRANDIPFISELSQEIFTKILLRLEPANSIEKLALAHLDISAHAAKQFGIQHMRFVADDQAYVLNSILEMRRNAGQTILLEQYKVLLRSARDLGNHRLAVRFFAELHTNGHEPDTECYNYLMASRVWNGVHDAITRHKMRVTLNNIRERQRANPQAEFVNYRIGDGGPKEDVLSTFNTLLRRGLVANEETYCCVIIAVAREGDLTTVKAMLRRVWGIDVDGIMAETNGSQLALNEMEESSPLHPSGRLLFAVAHAFTINNQVSVALGLVDFIARQYNLEINAETWTALFQSTFLLSRSRYGNIQKSGSAAGKLPAASVLHLWETMTGPPYNIKPTMSMYNHLIKNLWWRDMAVMMVVKMEEGRQIYFDSVETNLSLFREFKRAVDEAAEKTETSDEDRAMLARLRDEWELANLLRQRNQSWCRRWIRLLLAKTATNAGRMLAEDLLLRVIPRLLYDWSTHVFMANTVRYEVPGGRLEFLFKTEEEIDERAQVRHETRMRRQETLDRVQKFVGDDWYRTQRVRMSDRLRAKAEREQQDSYEDADEEGGADELDSDAGVIENEPHGPGSRKPFRGIKYFHV